MPRVAITSFYPKVEFLDAQYLGDGAYNTCYQECDYCKEYKKIYIDAANPSFIRALKLQIGDREDYENQIAYYKKMKWNWHNHMIVIPVSFNVEHKEMLGHAKLMLEKSYIAIDPIFDKLITSLRTAIAEENSLDKEATSYDDILDAYQLALKNYEFTEE